MSQYPSIIIIDCDANEIYGDIYLVPFELPKLIPSSHQSEDKKNKKEKSKKDKKSKENNDFLNNVNFGNKLTTGINLIEVNGSFLYKYEKNPNAEKKKILFDGKNDIIIDTQKSQLLIDKSYIFINSSEMELLRKNIQLVKIQKFLI